MNTKPAISTERLFIEPLTDKDASFMMALMNTEGWRTFIGGHGMPSEAEALVYIRRIRANPNIVYRIAKLRSTGQPIGLVTLIKRDYLQHPDIGFAFFPSFTNCGYAYEATRSVLMDLVSHHRLTYILAETMPENTASIKLLKKLGLAFEQELLVENTLLHIYGAPVSQLLLPLAQEDSTGTP